MKKILCIPFLISGIALSQEKKEIKEILLEEGTTFSLSGEVTAVSMGKLTQDILSSKQKEVNLVINSGGGSVFAAMEFVDNIKASGVKVNCIANWAGSAAFAIFQTCDNRLIGKNGYLMQHQASFGLRSQPVENQKKFSSFLYRMIERFEKMEYERIGWSKEVYFEKTRDDLWLIGDEAVLENVADEVVSSKCSSKLMEGSFHETVYTFFGPIKLEFSRCPLISAPISVVFDNKIPTDEVTKVLNTFKPNPNL